MCQSRDFCVPSVCTSTIPAHFFGRRCPAQEAPHSCPRPNKPADCRKAPKVSICQVLTQREVAAPPVDRGDTLCSVFDLALMITCEFAVCPAWAFSHRSTCQTCVRHTGTLRISSPMPVRTLHVTAVAMSPMLCRARNSCEITIKSMLVLYNRTSRG